MRVGVIGSGLQASRRLPAIAAHLRTCGVVIAGEEPASVELLASAHAAVIVPTWHHVIDDPSIDIVVVCTPPGAHREIVEASIRAHKHVLCEKPLTRRSADALALAQLAEDNGVLLKCGFNHRFHPAVLRAKQEIDAGRIGRPLLMRGLYGIGGRPGIEREWRSDANVAAGGQLMEQGIHLVDLIRWFGGEAVGALGMTATELFPIHPLEESGMAVLRGESGYLATVTSTLLQWRNTFELTVQGEDGYLEIRGLGGSYGDETLTVGARDDVAPFNEHLTYFRDKDKSWVKEWDHLVAAVNGEVPLMSDARDGAQAMLIVEEACRSQTRAHPIRHLTKGI